MSHANVAHVVGLQPAPTVDLAKLFRSDATLAALVDALDPDFGAVFVSTLLGKMTDRGVDDLREGWLEWLSPWEEYRTEIEEARDLGGRVFLLVRDFGRRKGSAEEVAHNGAAVWPLREDKVVRAEFYGDRTTAFEAVGLSG